jgi:hypothetical protein
MGHFAKLNENNIVIEVNSLSNFVFEINGIEDEAKGIEFLSSISNHLSWKQTSYNTIGGVYYESDNTPGNNQSKAFRKNYAGIGYTYDEQRDAFIPPQPYPSWVLDEFSCLWNSPIAHPDNGHIPSYYLPYNRYYWNEEITNWSLNKPFTSWQLSIEGYYTSPIPYPNDGNLYYWSEDTILWIRYEI